MAVLAQPIPMRFSASVNGDSAGRTSTQGMTQTISSIEST